MAANLSGASSLKCGLLSATQNLSPAPSRNIRSKTVCVYRAQCAAALNSSSKCIPFLITIMPQWQSSKLGLYSCRYELRQPPPHLTPPHPALPLEERNKRIGGEIEEQTVNSGAVRLNYRGTSVIKHQSTSEVFYFSPIPSSLFLGAHENMSIHNSWMQQPDLKCLQFIHKGYRRLISNTVPDLAAEVSEHWAVLTRFIINTAIRHD